MLSFTRGKPTKRIGKSNYGFSLVELLVVVAILAILAAIAIPLFLNQKNKAKNVTVRSDVHNLTMEAEGIKPASGNFPAGAQGLINNSGYRKTGMNNTMLLLDCKLSATSGVYTPSPGDYVITGFVIMVQVGLPLETMPIFLIVPHVRGQNMIRLL